MPVKVTESNKEIDDSIVRAAVHTRGSKSDAPLSAALTSVACIAILTAIVWLTFGRSLGSYFLADDFGEVAYAGLITHGRWDLFWLNWTGNYMQIPSMAVYRPWLMVTLVVDQIFWGANAVGYYIHNLFYVTGDAILLFALCKEIAAKWKPGRQALFALTAAALFAASPLHCESTSWVVGRVDTGCCFYYLASLLLFIKARKPRFSSFRVPLTISSILLFIVAMLTKEMAIGLPILVTAIAALFPNGFDSDESTTSQPGLRQRAVALLKEIAPYWIATAIYFAVRYAALGTIFGGYTGGIGSAQATSAMANWLQYDIYKRVAFPLPYSLYGLSGTYFQILGYAYTAALTLTLVRAANKDIDWKGIALVSVWIGTTLLPIYKLWALGVDLEGSRFLFFLTVPLSVLLPLLLLSPSTPKTPSGSAKAQPTFGPETAMAMVILLAILGTYLQVASRTDGSWVRAGREVRSCQQEAIKLAQSIPSGKRAIVLGIPKHLMAAHMIYNGDTFNTLLRPPFANADYSKAFITFDPILFGASEYINVSRFKQTLAEPDIVGVYAWNRKSKTFEKATLNARIASTNTSEVSTAPPSEQVLSLTTGTKETQVYAPGHVLVVPSESGGLIFSSPLPGDGLRFSGLGLAPSNVDFVEIQGSLKNAALEKAGKLPFSVTWKGAHPATSTNEENENIATSYLQISEAAYSPFTLRIPVSGYWRWFTQGSISELCLQVPNTNGGIEITNVSLLPATGVKPVLKVLNGTTDGTGIEIVSRTHQIQFDASHIPGATKLLVQSSQPNFFFDQQAPENSTTIFATKQVPLIEGKLLLSEDLCPTGGFTQIRIRAVNAAGKHIGEYSDAVTLLVAQ